MPALIKIRLAGNRDIPPLARLNQAFNGVVEPPECLAARLSDVRRVDSPILAEAGDRRLALPVCACCRVFFMRNPTRN
jgi:hypothetical protein